MPKLFAAAIALFLLLSAGYAITQAARSIPWNCDDWQAFAHSDRTTAILESLAENRGKTLYCGLDQSDTFGKAETWAAGKDRNERDDTVYFGERGSFRGFIAAQEGWLTDGESGITGQSIATIFEFPKEPRRVKRTKRFAIANTASNTDAASCGQAGGLICSDWGSIPTAGAGTILTGQQRGRHFAVGRTGGQIANWTLDRQTNIITDAVGVETSATPSLVQWQELLAAGAARSCRARGARYVAGSAELGPGHDNNKGSHGNNLGWFYSPDRDGTANYKFQARQSRTWTATCKKTIRRTR